jgi:predicted TIM-barrel fold metal-dependent hydrolase
LPAPEFDVRSVPYTGQAMVADAHAHFFSAGFFRALGRECRIAGDAASAIPAALGWDPPGDDALLADRWIAELDRHDVRRVMLIASAPGDERAVASAARRHPDRVAGAFMFNPAGPDAESRLAEAWNEPGLRVVCLFPAMHHVALDDPRVEAVFKAAARHARAVFVHCGVLSVGVRKKLGLPSPFDLRLGHPLGVARLALAHPEVPVIIPHFGAGFFREALMAGQAAPNIVLDTSSSNSWMKFEGLTLRDVFERAIDVLGPSRLMFGTDSSFFPRGWQAGVYEEQRATLTDLGIDRDAQAAIFGGNFDRLF